MTGAVKAAVATAFREEWGQIVATLIGLTGDWDLAEECAQDAFAQALQRWPRDGIPRRPGAWLTATACNRATDRLRREAVGAAKLRQAAMLAVPDGPGDDAAAVSGIPDDRLRLMFTCCHPALAFEARVALTLRTLAGLTTAEIARAFLVSEDTMSKRLVRAKRKIRNAGIPYRVPPAHLLGERTASVLGVLYLLFNEGYAASAGADLVRQNLTAEAIRLARLLARLLPDDPEVGGLLALLLLHDARRAARLNAAGELVPLEDQDRSRWDANQINEGVQLLEAALRRVRPGPNQVQAAIAACHATAPEAAATDWAQIAALYGQLARLVPSAVVELNRAVAVGMRDGPAVGLALVEQLEEAGELAGYHLLPATRADLLRRLGRTDEAAVAYREALELASTEPERATSHDGSARRRLLKSSRNLDEPVRLRPARSSVEQPPPRTREGALMDKVVSSDGTTIAFDRLGEGAPVILVSGASTARAVHAQLAELLAADFAVFNYDRRGRGDSGDTPPCTIQREVEDLQAVLTAAGGAAAVFGNSSGAALALHAAAAGLPLTRLALWEPPFMTDPDAPRRQQAYLAQLTELLDARRRGDAMALFMTSIGLPEAMITGMRQAPMWSGMEALAHTLAYDATIMGDSTVPTDLVAAVKAPTLVLDGSDTEASAANSARALTAALPNPRHHTLEGQAHNVAWDVLAPVLREFLTR